MIMTSLVEFSICSMPVWGAQQDIEQRVSLETFILLLLRVVADETARVGLLGGSRRGQENRASALMLKVCVQHMSEPGL